MSDARVSIRTRVLMSIAAASLIVFAPQLIGAKAKRAGEEPTSRGPQRVMAISENGPIVTLKLENGQVVDVAKSIVKIKKGGDDGASTGIAAQSVREHRKEAPSLQQLTAMSAANPSGLPVIATLAYKHDGNVKKAKIRVFSNEAEMNAFVAKRNERIAAARASTPNKEPRR